MTKVFFDSNGIPSQFPSTLKQAKSLRYSMYKPNITCIKCNKNSAKYVYNDVCAHCALLESIDFYNMVIGVATINNDQITTITDKYTTTTLCDSEKLLTAKELFLSSRDKFNLGIKPCKKAGHLGIFNKDGGCYYCATLPKPPQSLSPRQQAIRDHQTWYTPTTPCQHCHTTSQRNVNNGICLGCNPNKSTNARSTATSDMMKNCPDLIITRKDAKTSGLTVYRTGKKCKRGHKSYRYVSTNSCIACLRQKP